MGVGWGAFAVMVCRACCDANSAHPQPPQKHSSFCPSGMCVKKLLWECCLVTCGGFVIRGLVNWSKSGKTDPLSGLSLLWVCGFLKDEAR